MFLFKKKTTKLLGIDISATAVKLLELDRRGSKHRVESYAVEPLRSDAVTEKGIQDIEAVAESIRRAVKKSGSKTKQVAVAVAGSSVITKVINMPHGLSDGDMENQIQLEADQYIPFQLEEVAMDFEVMGESKDNPDQVDVLLAASRSENIDNRVAAMDLAGLTAKIVDVEAFAVENAVNMMAREQFIGSENQVIAVVDVGSTLTIFSVMENLKTIYSREQTFGGAQLTEDIQRRYGLSYEEAGLAKKQGGLPDNYEPEVLGPFKEAMAQQISRAQQFFLSSSALGQIDHLILAGGCSSIPGIAEMVEEKVGVHTTVANPFANMSIASRVAANSLSKDAPAMMISCGLALRSFE